MVRPRSTLTRHRVAFVTADSTANRLNLDLGPEGDDPITATYSGPAVGISVMTNDKGEGVASGHFDADVTLTARFAESPTLGGNIRNFRGSAVNTGWNVVLNQSALADTATLAPGDENGIAYGGDAAGAWTAQGYGPVRETTVDGEMVDHRPDGFFGRFDANMLDGMAAGAYATRKD